MKPLSWIPHILPSASLILMAHGSANELSGKMECPYQKELDCTLHAEVDYLLWFSNPNGLQSPTVATGKSPHLSSPWNSGVRAAIGGQSAHWNIDLCYSYYSTSSKDTANANIGSILASTPSTAGIFAVSQKWNLNFNRIDLQMGRKLLFGDHFLIEPFLGLEALDVSQTFNLSTHTIFLDLVTALPATNVVGSKNKNSLLGIGPRTGFKANLDFKSGFGLYGNFGANILWGRFKIKQNYNETDYYSSRSPTVLVNQIQDFSEGSSILNADLEIGLNWRHLFPKRNVELTLKAGWEEHYYIDIVRFHDFHLQQTSFGTASYITNGNLALSGLTVGILLNY